MPHQKEEYLSIKMQDTAAKIWTQSITANIETKMLNKILLYINGYRTENFGSNALKLTNMASQIAYKPGQNTWNKEKN